MALRPDLVGTRVVVRRVLVGETGPSGGPAMTDTLGELTAWSVDAIAVRREDGSEITIPQADIVAAKPVPPRASARQRITPEALERICADGWRAPVEVPLGEWRLRAASGFTGRANSVLTAGDPGLSVAEALRRVEDFYAAHGLPAHAQVIVGSEWLSRLEDQGWISARPTQADAVVQIASVTQALRATGRRDTAEPAVAVEISDTADGSWIGRYGRSAESTEDVVRSVLHGGRELGFAYVHATGAAVDDPAEAIGRAVITGDWVGLSAVEVAPRSRRRGIGRLIVTELLDWAASRGATSAYLQTLPTNTAALALYADFGFAPHHSYRYLRPPARPADT